MFKKYTIGAYQVIININMDLVKFEYYKSNRY